jgi:hypothetical protein
MGTNLNKMREEIKSGQAETRSTFDEWLMDLKDGRKETTACIEATDTKLDPALIQSTEEQEVIPKGEAAVMPVGIGNAIPWEIVDTGGNRLPPAGSCSAVQK